MRIVVDRFRSNDDATLSQIAVYNDQGALAFGCYGCEDAFHEPKIPGRTRIPAGTYRLSFRKEGSMYGRYCADRRLRGVGQERGMLWIREIPNFEYVYFHIGNTHEDTEGCPLVGSTFDAAVMAVWGSVAAYRKFYPIVASELEAGGNCIAEIQDNDRS